MSHLVFVYGSLMFGFGNNWLLRNSKFVGVAKTASKFTLISLGPFPALLRDGRTSVTGEVYEVNDKTLQRLDHLEGHPTFYCREYIDTTVGNVYAYLLQNADRHCGIVVSGDWRQFNANRGR